MQVGGSAAVQGVAADWTVMGVAVLLMIQLPVMGVAVLLMIQLPVHTADVDMVM